MDLPVPLVAGFPCFCPLRMALGNGMNFATWTCWVTITHNSLLVGELINQLLIVGEFIVAVMMVNDGKCRWMMPTIDHSPLSTMIEPCDLTTWFNHMVQTYDLTMQHATHPMIQHPQEVAAAWPGPEVCRMVVVSFASEC